MCGVLLMIFLPGYCLHLRLISPLSSPEERSQQNLKTEFKQIECHKIFLICKSSIFGGDCNTGPLVHFFSLQIQMYQFHANYMF